jgi:hypothetical protein
MTTFQFYVEVDVKNDAITRECGEHDIAMMLLSNLEKNKLNSLPWVIEHNYYYTPEQE